MKKILAMLMACVILAGLVPVSIALADTYPAVAKSMFTMRADPEEDARKTHTVAQNASLTVLQYGDDWCQVEENGYKGWAKTSWLRFRQGADLPKGTLLAGTSGETAQLIVPETTAAPETAKAPATEAPVQLVEAAETTETAAATATDAKPAASSVSFTTLNDVVDPNQAPEVGVNETGEIRYQVLTRVKFSIRETADEDAKRIKEIKKGGELNMLAYGTQWCLVQTVDGATTGYAKTKWLFHYHSVDRFRFEVPDYEQYKMYGYVEMTSEEHITDSKNLYGGNDLHVGDVIFVKGEPTDTATILLRRDFVTVPASSVTYHPVVDWREAKEGDVIGGYTQFYGKKQGGKYYIKRKQNIKLAMSKMNGTIIQPGEEYSFLTNVGPVTSGAGYGVAGITGGIGSGIGGGICHTSSLMYQAALSLPFLITEREPHTDDGTHYVPLEFDATVGVYSDFKFINTLPYPVKLVATVMAESGAITVRFVCMETVDSAILATWNGTQTAN